MSYRVYFGRLPESLSQDEFEKMLSEHGKPRNIEWKSGYAYVDYKHGSDASKTVQNLNGRDVGGNHILVELAQNGGGGYAVAGAFATRPFAKPPMPRPVRTPHRVRIENLSSRTRWMELKELLSLAGEVTFADTHKRKTGEGIVEFATREGMDEAIKTFHNTSFYGKTIKLYDESPRGRSRSPRGRSKSPSGQKSRSHSRHRSSERKKRSHSKSASPRRKSSSSRRRSRSPRRKHERQSTSRDRHRSVRKSNGRSRTPNKSSHKKSKKSKRHSSSSRSRSKSPKRTKHKRNRSRSHSSSDNNNDSKRKTKTKKTEKRSSDLTASDCSDSNKSK